MVNSCQWLHRKQNEIWTCRVPAIKYRLACFYSAQFYRLSLQLLLRISSIRKEVSSSFSLFLNFLPSQLLLFRLVIHIHFTFWNNKTKKILIFEVNIWVLIKYSSYIVGSYKLLYLNIVKALMSPFSEVDTYKIVCK